MIEQVQEPFAFVGQFASPAVKVLLGVIVHDVAARTGKPLNTNAVPKTRRLTKSVTSRLTAEDLRRG